MRAAATRQRPRLTQREAEALAIMQNEGVTGTQALASRLRISPRQGRTLKQRLREKGYLNKAAMPVGGCAAMAATPPARIRLHAVQLKVGVIGGVQLAPRVIPDFMGCRVVVHRQLVEVYAREGVVFYGVSEDEAQTAAMEFFERLGRRLENDLNCILIKPRSQNWEIVKAEWATEGSNVARRHIEEGVKLEVFATEDGHRWLWGDWSKQEPEHETGGSTGKVDSQEVNKHLNDWRDFHPPTNSQLFGMLQRVLELQVQTAEFQKEQAAGLATIIKLMQPPEQPKMPEGRRPDYFG